MDICDIGLKVTEEATAEAIARIRAEAKVPQYKLIGKCYTCETPLENSPFCSAECREDYEEVKRKQQLRRR